METKRLLKPIFFGILLIVAASACADQVDCKAAKRIYEEQLNKLSRQCSKATDCKSANLNWESCAKPIIYSDSEMGEHLRQLLTDLSGLCQRSLMTCEAVAVKPLCLDGMCEDGLNPGAKKDLVITIQFMQKSKPLAGMTVTLDADTGVRCITTPCPARMNLKSFTTDAEGKIHLTVGEVLALLNISSNPGVNNRYVGPDGYSVSIDKIGYAGIDLSGLLVNTQKVHVIQF
jgi:hypothetical protein